MNNMDRLTQNTAYLPGDVLDSTPLTLVYRVYVPMA